MFSIPVLLTSLTHDYECLNTNTVWASRQSMLCDSAGRQSLSKPGLGYWIFAAPEVKEMPRPAALQDMIMESHVKVFGADSTWRFLHGVAPQERARIVPMLVFNSCMACQCFNVAVIGDQGLKTRPRTWRVANITNPQWDFRKY